MPLLDLWATNPDVIEDMSIEQVVSTAGDGTLRDDNESSQELRQYLGQVSSELLTGYVEHCLTSSFSNSGFVLQDLVNELGRRLEYEVSDGRYRGTPNQIGNDGLWRDPAGHAIIVEVKTSDTYRISLDKLVQYRDELAKASEIRPDSSILIVVGRQDTGELEAQVRGSRHAWDIRIISVDALVSLIRLMESTEGSETGSKIRNLLVPREYTRLDEMVDIMFTTVRDVEAVAEADIADPDPTDETTISDQGDNQWQFTDGKTLQAKREEIVAALNRRESTKLVKKSRALYWSSDRQTRAAFTISKRYTKSGQSPYWYAYHPQWDEFLGEGRKSYIVLGCMDLPIAFAIPVETFRKNLDDLNVTVRPGSERHYWHIKILNPTSDEYVLQLPRSGGSLPLNEYSLQLL